MALECLDPLWLRIHVCRNLLDMMDDTLVPVVYSVNDSLSLKMIVCSKFTAFTQKFKFNI